MNENITLGRPDVTCSEDGCTNIYRNPVSGSREAAKHGWFIPNGQANGRVSDRPKGWCPEHIPHWLPEWRKKQIQNKKD